MSIQAVGWVLSFSNSKSLARLVLISIANHLGNDSYECWPSYQLIAKEAGVSRSTAAKFIPKLVELGELSLTKRHTPDGDWDSNCYRMPIFEEREKQGVVVRNTNTQSVERTQGVRPIRTQVYTKDGLEPSVEPSIKEVSPLATNPTLKTQEQIHENTLCFEQNTLPWMEKVWRDSGHKRFEKPLFDINRLEDRVGQEQFRRLWFENCHNQSCQATREWLSLITRNHPKNGNGNSHHSRGQLRTPRKSYMELAKESGFIS